MKITIRQSRPDDIDALLALLKQLFAIESDFSFDPVKQRKGLELMLSGSPDRCILVAEYQGSVIAMGSVQTLISTAEGQYVGLLEDLVVCDGYRSQGIGKKLLAELESWAERRGLARLQLLADQDNRPALAFYDGMGWSRTRMIGLKKLMHE